MRQKDLTITINLQNHTIKIKTTWMIIRGIHANKESSKNVLNLERLILMPSVTIF